MNWNKLKGKFIVLDGPDGAGKSTQVTLLSEFISAQGIQTISLRDPGGTRIGDQIRAILLNNEHIEMAVRCEMLLYMASRAQLYAEKIAPALTASQVVICDRWVSSTYAYQAVAGKIGRDLLLQLAETTLERTWPDLTLIIDLPSDEGMKRVGPTRDRMEQKSDDFHRQVRDAFLELAHKRTDFDIVNGAASEQEVHKSIIEKLNIYVDS